MLTRLLGLVGILLLSLVISGCTSCGTLDKFNAPNMPKLCHADNPPS